MTRLDLDHRTLAPPAVFLEPSPQPVSSRASPHQLSLTQEVDPAQHAPEGQTAQTHHQSVFVQAGGGRYGTWNKLPSIVSAPRRSESHTELLCSDGSLRTAGRLYLIGKVKGHARGVHLSPLSLQSNIYKWSRHIRKKTLIV